MTIIHNGCPAKYQTQIPIACLAASYLPTSARQPPSVINTPLIRLVLSN